jgi:type IV secretory pathway VirB10-like protein
MVPLASRAGQPRRRRPRWRRLLLWGGAAVALAALAAIAVVYWQLRSPPVVPPALAQALQQAQQAHAPSSPATASPAAPGATPPAAPGPASLPPARQQVEQIRQAVRQGYRGPVRVVVTEADLNQALQEATRGTPVREVVAAILEGEVAATGKVSMAGREMSFLLRAQPLVQDHRARLALSEVSLGRLRLPAAQVAQIQHRLDEELEKVVRQSGAVQISTVVAQRGVLIIDGYAQGP